MPEMSSSLDGMEFPELDGQEPDFHIFEQSRDTSAASARRIFGATRWAEDLTRPAPEWLIPGFLQAQSIHVVSAPKSARKTWLGLHTMLCGIYQLPWLGQTASQRFESIYVAADSPRWDVRGQLHKLIRGSGLAPQVLTECGSFLLPYGFKFTDLRHVSLMAELVAAWGIKAIFIDVLLYTYDGLNENDNTEMGQLFQIIKFFRDNLGLAVVLLHHHAKDPTIGARGAGTILQAAEHHYELRRHGPSTIITREKLRGDEDICWKSAAFDLTHTTNGGRTLTQIVAQPHPVETYLLEHPNSSRSEIVAWAQEQGRSARWADTILAVLRKSGKARSTDGAWELC